MSDTIDSRMPWVTNKVLRFLIVAADDVDFAGIINRTCSKDCLEMTRDVKVPLEGGLTSNTTAC